jgi:hypothetical protein
MYAWKSAGTWTIETADDRPVTSGVSAPGAGRRRRPAHQLHDNTNQHWLYAHKNAGAWETLIVDDGQRPREFGSIQMTASGVPAMACFDATSARPLYAYDPLEHASVGDHPKLPVAALTVSQSQPCGHHAHHLGGWGAHPGTPQWTSWTPRAGACAGSAGRHRERALGRREERGLAWWAGIHFKSPVGAGAGDRTGVRLVVVR